MWTAPAALALFHLVVAAAMSLPLAKGEIYRGSEVALRKVP